MEKQYYVYIMTNKSNTVLYTGVTNDLLRRVGEHVDGRFKTAFTKQYNINKLVYCEMTTDVYSAISREKQLKAGSRAKKIALIKSVNPEWKDMREIASSSDSSQ